MNAHEQTYSLQFSNFFEEFEALSESKDHTQVTVTLDNGPVYIIYFTTPLRFAQDAEYDLEKIGFYIEENLVLVPRITRATIVSAVSGLVASKKIALMRSR